MVELQTFCHEILGRILRDGRIVGRGERRNRVFAAPQGDLDAPHATDFDGRGLALMGSWVSVNLEDPAKHRL